MNLRFFLIVMTMIAVVSDSMLIPFYPEYFANRFGITDPQHAGAYIATFCCVVMLVYPFWAKVAKRIEPLTLLVYTQLAAGLLSAYCYWTTYILEFWIVSLCMFAFKASYLLMYPYVMSLESKANHAGTIGLLSVVVHFGGIAGAIVGGFVMQTWSPRVMFLVMAVGDLIQILMCLVQIRLRQVTTDTVDGEAHEKGGDTHPALRRWRTIQIYRLGLMMLLFYFSAYLVRPFFAEYWQVVSSYSSNIGTAFVFAIPGGMALLALLLNHLMRQRKGKTSYGIPTSLMLGACGLLMQGAPFEITILIGRCMFGWSLFQVTVHLDVLLFEFSTPESYASDFSKINIFQNLGVLISSFIAGALVKNQGLALPFYVGAGGFVLSALAYPLLTQRDRGVAVPHPDIPSLPIR